MSIEHEKELERANRALVQLVSEKRTINMQIGVFDAWVLVGCLQLGWRHPQLNPRQKELIEKCGRELQRGIAALSLEAARTLERGWDINWDVKSTE